VFDAVEAALVGLAASWWVFPAVAAICAIDGFFPPIPSETTVIAVTSVFAGQGDWRRTALLVVAAMAGAAVGDNIAYWIGHFFNPREWRIFASGRGRQAYGVAETGFRRRGANLLFAVRFVPVVRVAVNVVAGSLHYLWRRYVFIDLGASGMWAVYSVAIGWAGGSVMNNNPLVGVAIGVVLGVAIGAVVQRLATVRLARKQSQPPAD
jgi:membrane protein DedA with SNARE-associated domain